MHTFDSVLSAISPVDTRFYPDPPKSKSKGHLFKDRALAPMNHILHGVLK